MGRIGIYQCAGKPLAYLEMRMVIARVALSFDLEFAEDGTEKNYPHGQLDYFTLQVPPLSVRFLPRKRE
jgi:cytochrome P450